MILTKTYLIFSLVIFIFKGIDTSIKAKQTPCRRMLDQSLEGTEMECHDNDVIYVERQLITSEYVIDIREEQNPCNGTLRSEICTQSLPLNDSDSDRSQFIAGAKCNLRKRCVLDKNALNKSVDVFDRTCQGRKRPTREYIATSFTYRCVPREKLVHLVENDSTIMTTTDIYLITQGLHGNFSCEINGTVHHLSLLELSLTRLVIHRDNETIYNNNYRGVYGVDITIRNSSGNDHWYNLDISTERTGIAWIHLKGNFRISCRSTFLVLYTGTTADTLMTFTSETNTNTRHPQGIDTSIKAKQTPCRRMLDQSLEGTEMECHDNDVIYVERQLITSEYVMSVRDEAKPCNGTSRSAICTQSLPLNYSDSDRSQFIAGAICNLKKKCVLDKNALNKSIDVFDKTCQGRKRPTREYIATSFTYRCLPREKLVHLVENDSTIMTTTDIYLITQGLHGNFSCEINGTVHHLSLLELSLTRLVIHRDNETIYNNNNRGVYGVDITIRNSSGNDPWYNLDISTERTGIAWIHLKGNFRISCRSTFLVLYTGTTVDTLMTFTRETNTDTRHPQGSTSKTNLLLMLIIGLVVTLMMMVGLYTLHRRKDQKKLAELTKQTDTVSINFDHHVTETPVNHELGEEAGRNLYSEISSTRRHLLSFGDDT